MSERIKVRALGLGTVILNNHKKGYDYILYEDDGSEGREVTFSHKAPCAAGIIYELEMNPEKDCVYGKPSMHSVLDDHERAIELRATSRANEVAIAAYNQKKKAEKSHEDILSCLKPLRRAYFKTNAMGRMALEVRVLNYLRNGNDI